MADGGARLAIRLLQDAAVQGDLDPWDVDVIAVIDGFLDQLRQRITVPRLVSAAGASRGGSYEHDLAETSEAFLAASVLVSLKAEVLEASTLPLEEPLDDGFDADFDAEGADWGRGSCPATAATAGAPPLAPPGGAATPAAPGDAGRVDPPARGDR